MREDDEIVIRGLDSNSQGQQESFATRSPSTSVVVSGGDGTVTRPGCTSCAIATF
jgi:hypothetical protein